MIKVCHLTSAHRPNDNRIFYKECVSLAKEGYDVYLVATGESYVQEGVNVVGVGKIPSSRLERMLITTRKVYKAALNLQCEVYHLHDPELLPYAILLKRKGKKVIFDSHENVSEQILTKYWIPLFMRQHIANVYRRFEKYVTKKIDGVIIVTPSQIPLFKEVQNNLQMITNYPIIDQKDLTRNQNYLDDKNIHQICFAGGITPQWNHLAIASVLAIVPSLRYCIAGPTEDEYLAKLLNNPSWNNQITYLGILDQTGVANLYTLSLCGMALLGYDTQVGREGTLGNTKLFEYMKYGLPIICSDLILWKNIIDKHNCGITVNPNNLQEIIDALNFLIHNPVEARKMGNNGHRAFIQEYNWDTQVPKLLQLYAEITK